MNGVSVSRLVARVGCRQVGNRTVQQDQRATLGFETYEIVERVGLGVKHVGYRRGAGVVESRARADSQTVPARNCPHTTILLSGIVNGKPETNGATWLGPQICVVSMTGDFTADMRLLEDIHRLQQQRLAHADVVCNCSQFGCATKRAEHWIKVVHGMAELV